MSPLNMELAMMILIGLWALVAFGSFLQRLKRIGQTLEEIKVALQAGPKAPAGSDG
jgi:hypothetical protein